MDDALRELYQDLILDHSRNPRNFGRCAHETHAGKAYNPLCGDDITVSFEMAEDKVKEARFEGKACAICLASASLMTEKVTAQPLSAVTALFDDFQRLLTDDQLTGAERDACVARLGKLSVLSGVQAFPMRVKCATLPWHGMKKSILKKIV